MNHTAKTLLEMSASQIPFHPEKAAVVLIDYQREYTSRDLPWGDQVVKASDLKAASLAALGDLVAAIAPTLQPYRLVFNQQRPFFSYQKEGRHFLWYRLGR